MSWAPLWIAPFGICPVANRVELSYFWAINCEPGNLIAAPESRAHGLSLAARGRAGGVDCAVCVSRVSLGDQTDLRRNARARRQGGGVRGAKGRVDRRKIHGRQYHEDLCCGDP